MRSVNSPLAPVKLADAIPCRPAPGPQAWGGSGGATQHPYPARRAAFGSGPRPVSESTGCMAGEGRASGTSDTLCGAPATAPLPLASQELRSTCSTQPRPLTAPPGRAALHFQWRGDASAGTAVAPTREGGCTGAVPARGCGGVHRRAGLRRPPPARRGRQGVGRPLQPERGEAGRHSPLRGHNSSGLPNVGASQSRSWPGCVGRRWGHGPVVAGLTSRTGHRAGSSRRMLPNSSMSTVWSGKVGRM